MRMVTFNEVGDDHCISRQWFSQHALKMRALTHAVLWRWKKAQSCLGSSVYKQSPLNHDYV